jgi:hypothetical protein
MIRRLLPSAVAVLALTTAAPAHATGGAVVLVGGMSFTAGTCGQYATGQFWAEGTVHGPVTAYGAVCSPTDLNCLVNDTIDITLTGAVNVTMTYARFGAVLIGESVGDITGYWTGVVDVTNYGTSCNRPVDVTMTIALAGL